MAYQYESLPLPQYPTNESVLHDGISNIDVITSNEQYSNIGT